MCTNIRIYAILLLCILLGGCVNTMYFYETEKVSLTVEARPDSSQPVQGSLGIKQRVAMIVPKKSSNDTGDGEALSAISSFNFRIMDEPGFDPILIQTAFITGKAAADLNDQQVTDAAQAIKLRVNPLPSLDSYASCISNKVKSDSVRFNKLKEIVNKKDFKGLSDDEWKEFEPDLKACNVDTPIYFDMIREKLQKEMK